MIKKFINKYFIGKLFHLKDISKKTDNRDYQFVLKYHKDDIGYLDYSNSVWSFYYSDWFKNQSDIKTLLEFPKSEEKYSSNQLWVFFANRIPSFKQPNIKEFIKNNPNEKTNLVKLLGKFGKYSVNNPFVLEYNKNFT
ncbi:MAG: hypothetical protein OXC03_00185 [Flavobacteriaceae bacterium]|nr:hypothetical protein [Flavobacteriaceae bacterium]